MDLRCKPLSQPSAITLQRVPQPVVQAAFAALPELPVVGLQAIAAPVRWAGRVIAKFGGEGSFVFIQHPSGFNHLTLRAGPRAYA